MKILITQPGIARLKEIHDYYKERVHLQLANKIKTGIIEKIGYIEANPYLGQTEEMLEELGLNHRRFVQGNYKIIYRIEDDVIYTTDIFDSRQDPSKMLG
jgi:toxin ParE1/3/4